MLAWPATPVDVDLKVRRALLKNGEREQGDDRSRKPYDLDQRIEQAVREVMGRTTRAAAGGNAMTANWHFNVDDKGVVHLQARFEGDDGTVGDAHDVVEPGGEFPQPHL